MGQDSIKMFLENARISFDGLLSGGGGRRASVQLASPARSWQVLGTDRQAFVREASRQPLQKLPRCAHYIHFHIHIRVAVSAMAPMKKSASVAEKDRHLENVATVLWHHGHLFSGADDGKIKVSVHSRVERSIK